VSAQVDHTGEIRSTLSAKASLSRTKVFVFSILTVCVSIGNGAAFYVGIAAQRTRGLFYYARTNQRGWTGGIHRLDAELGYVTAPNARGAEILGVGPDIPVRHDDDGFRIPVAGDPDAGASRARPMLLTLGCSFTYGAANPAEDTYSYLVGQYVGGTARNGGVSGYGLSQMIIRARRLVPKLKPDYLIVQYSPWLAERALNPFAPAYFGKVPAPFFYWRGGRLGLHRPLFDSITMDVPLERYRGSTKSVANFASFFLNVGLPLLAHDDVHMALYGAGALLGTSPPPIRRRDFAEFLGIHRHEVERFAYQEIAKVARTTNTKVVAVIIGAGEPGPVADIFPDDFLIVDAQSALRRRLPDGKPQTYQHAYGHWRGVPAQLIDGFHPNAAAHRIIAQEIAAKINEFRR